MGRKGRTIKGNWDGIATSEIQRKPTECDDALETKWRKCFKENDQIGSTALRWRLRITTGYPHLQGRWDMYLPQ